MEANAPPTKITIGNVDYLVEIGFSPNAKETAKDKISRLLLEDLHYSLNQVSKDTLAN